MSTFLFGFLVVFLLIILNGSLAMTELAIVSARRARLQQMAAEGVRGAQTALRLADDPGDFLSAVQIGITLIGILTGAFGGATLSAPVARQLEQIPLLAPVADPLAVGLMVLVTTYLSLVVGELTPKRIALNNAERIACRAAPPMVLLARLTAPLVWLLDESSELLLRLLGIRPSELPPVTEEEVRLLLQQGTSVGVFEPIEEEIVSQVFRLSDRRVGAIMTPRPDVEWIDINDSVDKIRAKVMTSGHSRFPLAKDGLDDVTGIVLVKDLLTQQFQQGDIDLEAAARPAVFVPETMTALEVVERLRDTRTHLALVINEYGGFEGLVTISDVVEAILGSVDTGGEEEEPEIMQRADGSWLIDGMLPVDEFQEFFDLKQLPRRGEVNYQTVGGMIMTMLGRMPVVGDTVALEGHDVEVVDMDGHRVDKILVTTPDTSIAQVN